MRHQRVEEWESKLNELLMRVDSALEDKFGSWLAPHPSRPARGSAANPQYDGLFSVNTGFTAGFGSKLGRGYVVQIDAVTLEAVPVEKRHAIESYAAELIREGLKTAFPGTDLALRQDGPVWKIVGDLSLPEKRT